MAFKETSIPNSRKVEVKNQNGHSQIDGKEAKKKKKMMKKTAHSTNVDPIDCIYNGNPLYKCDVCKDVFFNCQFCMCRHLGLHRKKTG